MSLAIPGYPVTLQLGDAVTPTEAFTTISEVKDFRGPSSSLDVDEVTNHSSTNGWEEHIPTILRSGEIAFQVNFIVQAATHANAAGGLRYLAQNRTKRNFRVVFTDSAPTTPVVHYLNFAGYVVGFDPSWPVKGAVTADFRVKVTGPVTDAVAP